MFAIAASIAEVPDPVNKYDLLSVWNTSDIIAVVSSKISPYTGPLWFTIGCAIASNTLLGTVVGPGIINKVSSIGNIPPNYNFFINVYLKSYNKIVLI